MPGRRTNKKRGSVAKRRHQQTRAMVLTADRLTLLDPAANNAQRASIQFNPDGTITLLAGAGAAVRRLSSEGGKITPYNGQLCSHGSLAVRLRNVATGQEDADAVTRADLTAAARPPLVVRLSQTGGRLCEETTTRINYGTTLSAPPAAVWSWANGPSLASQHRRQAVVRMRETRSILR